MQRKVRSVRVPEELSTLDLSGLVREFEKYLRDIESAIMLKAGGNKEAAEALVRARQSDLGRKIAKKIWEAKQRHHDESRARQTETETR